MLTCANEAIRWVDGDRWTYEVEVASRFSIDPAIQVITPRITITGALPDALAEVTSGTADAVIYYTLDGTYPGPANPAAILYAGAIPITADCALFAVAYKAGLSGSNPAFRDLTL
jgi:hypothetical protein